MSPSKCKTTIFLMIIIVAMFFIGSQANQQENMAYAQSNYGESQVGKILQGEHPLRKMVTKQSDKASLNGSFFLIFGEIRGQGETFTKVTFSWLMNDSIYAISSLPIEKIRIKFIQSKEAPSIKFRWRPDDYIYYGDNLQEIMNDLIIYALVTCREKDWPAEIQLPLNQGK